MPFARLSENAQIRHNALRAGAIMVGLVVGGTAGYVVIEGWSPFDALYMTAITLSTIGYGETRPLTDAGRVFTLFLIVVGVGNIAYAFGTMTGFFATGGYEVYRRRARMERQLAIISGHTIVCGFGRVGEAIVQELLENKADVVVVERDPAHAERLRDLGVPYVLGDAADDHVLAEAGIARARTFVAAVSDDASNVFLTLTARVLSPAIVIYGKAEDPNSLVKLARAGANVRFNPSLVAGHRVAMQILRPATTDLVELSALDGGFEVAVQELQASTLRAVGQPLRKTAVWNNGQLMVVAVQRADGTTQFPPRPDYVLQEADRVVVMGRSEALAGLPMAAG